MPIFLRRAFPYFAIGLLIAALAWAVSFGTLPPAEFSFDNGTEIETIDPALATGQPENRIINGLFEGLLRNAPPDNWESLAGPGKNVPMSPLPAMAESYDDSDDGRVYTFQMRGAKWTDGTPVTAHDFAWSWMRMLHPETASRYANLLYDYVAGGKEYNSAQVEPEDRVEIELADRADPLQPFPRGTVLRGILRSIDKPPQPQLAATATDEQRADAEVDWKRQWVYTVEVKPAAPPGGESVAWDAPGQLRVFAKEPAAAARIERCLHVLPDFASSVGIKADGPDRFVVTLANRTPYFADLVAFYPLYPVNRTCVETHGTPNWTRPENIVGNGPFRLEFRRIRDRIRMVKNPTYWDADRVRLEVVDALATKSATTALNMYLNGQIDWAPYQPPSTIPLLKREYSDQFHYAPMLTTYFYRINVTRPEVSDKRVRQALNLAIDKQAICERVTQAGEIPAATYVPPGLAGYVSPAGGQFNVERARTLLAEAGYPGGRGLAPIEILYNDMDVHKTIGETIQQMWRVNLGVAAELRGLEWGVYLDSTHNLDYDVARAGWIADYNDPNTFLDLFMSGNANNQTGWGSPRYDELMGLAAAEGDIPKRMALLGEAETLLLDEQPIIPIYFYVSKNLVHPRVKGFFSNVQDEHPLKFLKIERP